MVCDCGASCWGFFCGCLLHRQPQDPLGCCTTLLAASACSAPALEAWGGQPLFLLHSQCLTCAGWPGNVRWVPHPVRLPFVGDYWLLLWVVMRKRLWLLFVWECCGVRTPQHFQTLVLAMSVFDFISCASLCVDWVPLTLLDPLLSLWVYPLCQVWHCCVRVLAR